MKVRGYFFTAVEISTYEPAGMVFGQAARDSCVAACCRMILQDHGITVAEAYLRDALALDEGSYVSQIPDVLREFGIRANFVYHNDLVIDDLIAAVGRGSVVAFVKTQRPASGHALLVDSINEADDFNYRNS